MQLTHNHILDLDGSIPEPMIWSGDTGRRIPCFDSCQLITTWTCNIRLQAPKLARRVSVRLNIGFPVVQMDGQAVSVQLHDYEIFAD